MPYAFLQVTGQWNSTLLVLTSKHGAGPVNLSRTKRIDASVWDPIVSVGDTLMCAAVCYII